MRWTVSREMRTSCVLEVSSHWYTSIRRRSRAAFGRRTSSNKLSVTPVLKTVGE